MIVLDCGIELPYPPRAEPFCSKYQSIEDPAARREAKKAAWKKGEPFDGVRDHDINRYIKRMNDVVLGD